MAIKQKQPHGPPMTLGNIREANQLESQSGPEIIPYSDFRFSSNLTQVPAHHYLMLLVYLLFVSGGIY